MTKLTKEFEKFNLIMHELIKIPHADIKAKLDAEKNAKKRKKSKKEKL